MRNNKTEGVLRLVDLSDSSSIKAPKPAPSLKPSKAIAEKSYIWNGERQIVNLTALVLNEQMCLIGERFGCCLCEECCTKITQELLKKPYFLAVTNVQEALYLNEQLAEYRPLVIKELTRIAILAKKNPLHNQ